MKTKNLISHSLKHCVFGVLALCLVLASLPNAGAAVVVYTTRAAFNAATTGQAVLDFTGTVTAGTNTFYAEPTGITVSGINYRSSTNQMYAIDQANGASFNFASGNYLNNNDYTGTSLMNVTSLPANTTAIGGDYGLQTVQSITQFTLTLTLSTGDIVTRTLSCSPTTPVLSFIGVTSTTAITSMSIKGVGVGNSGSASVDNFTTAQAITNVVVSGSTGADGPYATLGAAFAALNANTTQTGNTIQIAINGSTTETATAVLNSPTGGNWTSLTISPAGGAARSVSGAITAGSPLIDVNGADNVTFDGLNTGGNSLTISNTTVSATSGTSTIRFQTDATNNTITNCSILGSATMGAGTNGGNIWFGSAAVTTGNDNNTVSNCNIGPAGSNLPSKCLYFSGSSNTDPGTANSGIVINNNNIFDYFSAAVSTAGVDLNTGTVGTTISNNKFYQTATRTMTTTSLTHSAIRISNTSGNAYQITGNTIGFAAANGTGAYTIVTTATSPIIPINLSVGSTTATSVQNNTIAGMAISGASSGTSSSGAFRGIYVAGGLTTIGNVTGNTIGSQSATGSITYTSSSTSASDVIAMFNFGSDNWTASNNLIGGITASNSSTGASNVYGVRVNTVAGATFTCQNNTVGGTIANSIQSTTTATGTVVNGILNNSPIGTISGNIVRNLTTAGGTGTGTTASITGILATTSSTQAITQNTLNTFSATGASTVNGITSTSTGSNTISKNKIYDLQSNNAAGLVNGMLLSGSGTTVTVANNLIGDLRAPASTVTSPASAVIGLNITSASTLSAVNASFNTIFLNASSSGANFATTGVFHTTSATATTAALSLRNNIIVNTSTPAGTGLTVAYRRSSTTLTNYASTSNNNDFYAGTPGAARLIFSDGTNADQTISAYKTRVASRDSASVSENPPFLSTIGSSATFLHLDTVTPTQLESGGIPITGITDDFDGDTRNATTPDVGADEFSGTLLDLNPPTITYTPLGNTGGTGARTLTATITDPSGVPISGIGLPVLYWKINAGSYTAATAASLGSNQYQFSFGSGVNSGDSVSYYIVAQDSAGTPNVGSNPSAGASGFTANPPAASTPPTTPSSYAIVLAYSGPYNVGTAETYTSLSGAGGLFSAINGGVVTGNITVNVTSDLTETGGTALNQWIEEGGSGFTVTIQSSGAPRIISGSNTTTLVDLNGADRVTFSGAALGGQSLTIRNTSATTGSVIRYINDASNNSIVSCILEQNNTSSSAVLYSTGVTTGNDNNTISGSIIRGTSSTVMPFNSIVSSGTSTAISNSNLSFTNNQITDFGQAGILTLVGTDNLTISGNDISQTANRTTAIVAINLNNTLLGTNLIASNKIHGLRTSVAAGTSLSTEGIFLGDARATTVSRNQIYDFPAVAAGTGRIVGIEFGGSSTNAANVKLINNFISISTTVATNQSVMGIFDFAFAGNTITSDFNSIYIGGTSSGTSASWALVRGTLAPTTFTARDNVLFNNRTGGGANHFAVGDQSANTGTFVSNFNFFAGTGTTAANFFDYGTNGAGTPISFATWKLGPPTRDANSTANTAASFTIANIFANAAAGDLHLLLTATPVLSLGNATGTGVTDDIDGDARQTPPDIGADELVTYTLTYTAGANGSLTGTTTQTVISGGSGTAVTAVPNAGYHFVNWTPGGSTANPRTDTNVMADVSVTANFAINTYQLSVVATTGGTITAPASPPVTVNHGDATTITASANAGYTFSGWTVTSGTASITNAALISTTVTLTSGNATVQANFTINTYNLNYAAGANGTLTGTTSQTVNYGTDGTPVTAVPNTGYHFVDWTPGGSTANPRTDTNVMADVSVTANFAINTYQLTVVAGSGGTFTAPPSSPVAVNHGDATTITASANAGYTFSGWTVTSGSASIANAALASTTVTLTSGNATVQANFTINTYNLNYAAGANGTLTGTTSQTVNYGTDGTPVTAVPNTGYHFVDWTPGGSTANPRTDTNVMADVSVTANFAINTYQLSVVAGAGGTFTAPPSSPTTVNHGVATTITASANAGFVFSGWTVTSGSASIANAALASTTVTLTSGDATVQANFTATYTVTYDANGGTGTQTDPNSPYNSGSTVTVLNQGSITRTGFTFSGWNTAANGSGTSYSVGATFTITADTTLFAQWKSSNANLSNLTATAGPLSPAFDPNTVSYTINVPFSTSSTTVTPTTADATATVTVNGNAVASGSPSASISLNIGNNPVTVLVSAQDETGIKAVTTVKTYTINIVRGGNVVVSGSTGADGNYATVKDAFDALNTNGTQAGNTISVSIIGDTTETATAALNQPSVSSWTSLTVTPSGARTVTGSLAAPLIDLAGADKVTINGLNAAGNSLTISNTNTGATTSTIRFINGATNDTVTNCSVLGSSTGAIGAASGNILFSTSTDPAGNSSNTISNNFIGPAGANLPTKGVMGLGTAANPNINNVIDNNNIADFFNATVSVSGISVQANNSLWTISNNRLYQTAPRVFTGAALRYGGITLNFLDTGTVVGGVFNVTGNTIGFGAANGTGTTTISGSTNEFRGIDAENTDVSDSTSIQGNTISGINQTTARNTTLTSFATASTAGFIGIQLGGGAGFGAGLFNVGDVAPNKIGSLDASSSIVINATSTTNGTLRETGILDIAQSDDLIANNQMGTITINSGGTGTRAGFEGIQIISFPAQTVTVNNNTIGGTAAGSITDNIVGQYLMQGIAQPFIFTGGSGNINCTGNIIRNMVSNSNVTGQITMRGIVLAGSVTPGVNLVSQNTIHSLVNIVAGANLTAIYAMDLSFPDTANVVERNFIHSCSITTTNTTSQVRGILVRGTVTPAAASRAVYQNNMIRLGRDAAGASITTPYEIIGIVDSVNTAGQNSDYYFNSIYIGGSGVASPGSSTFAFVSSSTTTTRNFKDNIFWNARSNAVAGGTPHFAISIAGTTPNPAGTNSNFNDLFASGTDGNVGRFNAINQLTLANWQAATGQDANSISADPQFVNPTGTAATVDLHITCASPADGAATPIAGITNDFDNDTRHVTNPDIGADEINLNAPTPVSAVSRLVHTGVGPFDVNLPFAGPAGVEPRSGGLTGDYHVVFTFASNVTVSNAVLSAGTGMVTGVTGSGTNTITVDLTGITNAQYVTVKLLCVFDGVNLGSVSATMGVLLGDTTASAAVDSADISQVKSQSGNAVTGSNFREDLNVDGDINSADISLVKSRTGTALP